MFIRIKQLFMKKKENKGILAKDMSLAQLKSLAVYLGLYTNGKVETIKKADILKAVTAWEKKAVKESRDAKTGLRKLGNTPEVAQEQAVEDFYNGKKVLSRTDREINGKMYEDIKVVGGETFTNPK